MRLPFVFFLSLLATACASPPPPAVPVWEEIVEEALTYAARDGKLGHFASTSSDGSVYFTIAECKGETVSPSPVLPAHVPRHLQDYRLEPMLRPNFTKSTDPGFFRYLKICGHHDEAEAYVYLIEGIKYPHGSTFRRPDEMRRLGVRLHHVSGRWSAVGWSLTDEL